MHKSKIAATVALLLTIAAIIMTAVMRAPWWWYSAEFFAYMGAFSHLVALLLARRNPYVGRILDRFALIFGIFFVVALISLYIFMTFFPHLMGVTV